MAGEGVDVAADGLHIHLEVSHRLGTIDQGQGADSFGGSYYLRYRIDSAEGIGDMGHAHQSGARSQHG